MLDKQIEQDGDSKKNHPALGSAGGLFQQRERVLHRRQADVAAAEIAVAALEMRGRAGSAAASPKWTRPTGFVAVRAARTGDAGDRHRDVRAERASAPSAMARATGSLTAPCSRDEAGRHAEQARSWPRSNR